MQPLAIRKYPDPVLREKSKKIKDPLDKKIQDFILSMIESLHTNGDGIGLAAPQVGKNLNICIIELEGLRYIIINPKITAKSRKKSVAEEGCLSFPGLFLPVSRHEEVQVRYLDENGQPQKIKGRGLLARAFQHEIDHLEGILFIDRAEKNKKNKINKQKIL
jgi:peptide deformylase